MGPGGGGQMASLARSVVIAAVAQAARRVPSGERERRGEGGRQAGGAQSCPEDVPLLMCFCGCGFLADLRDEVREPGGGAVFSLGTFVADCLARADLKTF